MQPNSGDKNYKSQDTYFQSKCYKSLALAMIKLPAFQLVWLPLLWFPNLSRTVVKPGTR